MCNFAMTAQNETAFIGTTLPLLKDLDSILKILNVAWGDTKKLDGHNTENFSRIHLRPHGLQGYFSGRRRCCHHTGAGGIADVWCCVQA
jgi:hypothetical protein